MAITLISPVTDIRNVMWSGFYTAHIVTADAIRNTSTHDATNDTAIAFLDCRQLTGGKVLFVNNTTDQTASVNIVASFDGVTAYSLGSSKTIANGAGGWYDPNSATQLGYGYPYMSINITFSVSPTTGAVDAYLMCRTV